MRRWERSDLVRRLCHALDISLRVVRRLAANGYTDRADPAASVRPEKAIAETAVVAETPVVAESAVIDEAPAPETATEHTVGEDTLSSDAPVEPPTEPQA